MAQDSPLDFSKYGLEQLGEDVRSLVDVPGAIRQTAKFGLTLPFVVALVTWLIFSSRMGWPLLPFTFVAFVLSFGASMVIGGFFLARKRLDTVASASSRVVDVIGEMHADVEQVRDGNAETSVQQVAVGLLENAILPAVFGTLTTTAETAMGPLGRMASTVTKAPMKLVEKSVISAVKALPDRKIGAVVDDVGAALPNTDGALSQLRREYATVRDKMESIVARVSRTAVGSVLGLALIAAIPPLIWLALGWLLT